MRTLIKNGRIIQKDNELEKCDIWIEDDLIYAIGQSFENRATSFDKVYDARNQLVSPGLIDVHVHFREPGFEYKETIKTGSLAAAHGGFTQVCAMPNLNPVPDTADKMKKMLEKIAKDAVVKVHQYAPITRNRESEVELVNFSALKNTGAWNFSNDGSGVQMAGTMYRAMVEAAKVGKTIVAHAEDNSLLNGGVIRGGSRSQALGIPEMLSIVESSQVARDLLLARQAGCHYHVCHISTKETVGMIREAKRAGIHVTCEVTPHHLLLTDEDILEDDAKWKMNPPLPSKEDREALMVGLLDGTIDMIATDHAPHAAYEKETNFLNGAFGIVGLEQAFSLLYSNLVEKGVATLEQLIHWMSTYPAEIFGMDGGSLQIGKPADLVVIDIQREFTIDEQDFESKGRNTPFLGSKVRGEVLLTFVDGRLVWRKSK
ncbi:MAG: dihydroorotase [Lactobacillales bacterium]|jgi:dihydroorotase|nr:dihydroorotase [Lactobacillales bacterium]